MKRLVGVLAAGILALGACSGSAGDPGEPEATVTTIETTSPGDETTEPTTEPTPEPANEPTAIADRPESLRSSDLTVTEADGVIYLESDAVHFQVPSGYVDETPEDGGIVFHYVNSSTGQSITLMPVGVASAVTSGAQYLEELNSSGNLGDREAQYWSDPMFGQTPARHFEILGGEPAAIYAFSYGPVAYELTINAPQSYLIEELRPFALATSVEDPTEPEAPSSTPEESAGADSQQVDP